MTRGRHKLALVRSVAPVRIGVGQSAEVTLHLRNEGRGPTGLLLLEEQVPYSVGTRPRFVIDRMPPTWERKVTYRIRSDVRGRFTLGPVTVRAADPFGLVELDRAFRSTATVTVTPKVVAAAGHRAERQLDRLRATTGPATSPAAAPRTSRCASTAAATTCAASTGAPAPTPAS